MSLASGRFSLDLDDVLYKNLMFITWTLLVGMTILPFLYAFFVSFRPEPELVSSPHWIPQTVTFQWWERAFVQMGPYLWNSLVIASGTAIISMLITIPSAYAFGRQDFPGRKFGFYAIIVALTFPYIILVIPLSDIWDTIGIFDTVVGLWLAYQVFVTPFAIWILRDFFERLPPNLEEAAQVYGCSQWEAFYNVMLPLAAPGLVAVGFLAFLVGWNDFLFSNMLTTAGGPVPAVVQIFASAAGQERVFWGLLMAETLIIGLPPTILYMLSRRFLSEAFVVEE